MPYALLDQVMSLAGEQPASHHVEFTGADPILPTPLRVGEVGAASIAAAHVQAARLWEMRSGRMQKVRVAVDAAAVAMRAARYLRVVPPPGSPPPERRMQGEGRTLFSTRDGRYVYFQRLFKHHQERTAAALGCNNLDAEYAEACLQRDAQDIEDAIVAAGATGGKVRTYEEWYAHDQAKALSTLPLFEIIKIGDSPPEPLPAGGDRPLSGIRMLDVTRVLAGPTAGRTFAEHGADVLRIGSERYPDNDAMMRDTGHGKRSAALDLGTPEGVATLKSLIPGADVFSQGYRPGTLAARGFSPEAVAALRPGIVYVTLSAFSHAGPWSGRRGFDSVVQACSGMYDEMTPLRGEPTSVGANVLDYSTGYLAAFGAFVALGRRAREGGSWLVRVSLAQTGKWLADQPRIDFDAWKARPNDLPQERLDELMMTTETPFGTLRHFGPPATLSETPPRWDRPTVPLNYHQPEWL